MEKKQDECNRCDFVSSWAKSLRNHRKIHSGERSCKCNQCILYIVQCTAIRESDLRGHLKSNICIPNHYAHPPPHHHHPHHHHHQSSYYFFASKTPPLADSSTERDLLNDSEGGHQNLFYQMAKNYFLNFI